MRQVGVVAFLVVCLLGGASALSAGSKPADPDSQPVASVMFGTYGIDWLPKVSYGSLRLTVAGPDGAVFNKEFAAGKSPRFEPSDLTGKCPDGSYTYELRVAPVGKTSTRGDLALVDTNASIQALTQTGHFRIANGAILVPQASESNTGKVMDVVHADDVIITGSQCIGYDCATDGSESFGFDTIKLKENNLQIFFDDTSTTAGFPANDWRLIANDSTSGGGNYFKLVDSTNSKTPFKIEANARDNALYVNGSGRVGLGTSTPVLDLHIVRGDTPSIRLDQDTTSGWTAQVWDLAGNESNFFIRDVTGGSKLPFRIQPGTPTNTLTMKSDGKVGIGTWSPTYPLEIDTTGINASIGIKRTDGAINYINATDAYGNFGTVSNHPLRLVSNSVWRMRVNTDNSLTMANGATLTAGGTWTDASSIALKSDVQTLNAEAARQALSDLRPVTFNYKATPDEPQVGFIAEEVPALVAMNDRRGLSPMDIVAVLTKVVQEQQKTIDELNRRVAELEKQQKNR